MKINIFPWAYIENIPFGKYSRELRKIDRYVYVDWKHSYLTRGPLAFDEYIKVSLRF